MIGIVAAMTNAYDEGVVAGKQEGAAAERAQIVAWLEGQEEGVVAFVHDIAEAIARGEHAQPPAEGE